MYSMRATQSHLYLNVQKFWMCPWRDNNKHPHTFLFINISTRHTQWSLCVVRLSLSVCPIFCCGFSVVTRDWLQVMPAPAHLSQAIYIYIVQCTLPEGIKSGSSTDDLCNIIWGYHLLSLYGPCITELPNENRMWKWLFVACKSPWRP